MPTVSESVCCQEIPETEGKIRELDVQNTVSQIMRGSDQFAWTDGCCKQLPCKCTSKYRKNSGTNRPTYDFIVFTLFTRMWMCGFNLNQYFIIPGHYVTWLTGNWQDGAGKPGEEFKLWYHHVLLSRLELNSHLTSRFSNILILSCRYRIYYIYIYIYIYCNITILTV